MTSMKSMRGNAVIAYVVEQGHNPVEEDMQIKSTALVSKLRLTLTPTLTTTLNLNLNLNPKPDLFSNLSLKLKFNPNPNIDSVHIYVTLQRITKLPNPFEKQWLDNLGNLGSNIELEAL